MAGWSKKLLSFACLLVAHSAFGGAAPAEAVPERFSTPTTLSSGIPDLTPQVVLDYAGLDPETLELFALREDTQRQLDAQLATFMKSMRPRLLTYRMIWSEMAERHRNLDAAAQANAFDPCEFVTDEALEAASHRLRDAQEQFSEACRSLQQEVSDLLDEPQMQLVRHASLNRNLPSPYRWLDLNEVERKNIRRVVEVQEARRELIERYPHLADRFDEDAVPRQVHDLLNAQQQKELARLQAVTHSTSSSTPTLAPAPGPRPGSTPGDTRHVNTKD